MGQPPSQEVSFLFSSIEGSSKYWAQQPEAMSAAMACHDALLAAAVAQQGGTIFQSILDARCIAFPSADAAIAATIAAQRQLQAQDWGGALDPLWVKMALDSGAAERHEDGSYFAPHTLNRISRLLAVAHGGQIIVSPTTVAQIGNHDTADYTLRDLGERRLRDLAAPLRLYQIVAPDLAADFPPLQTLDPRPHNLPASATSFVGRADEQREIKALLRHPDVRLVTLSGPGGAGKTRLCLEVAGCMIDEFAHGVYFVPLSTASDTLAVVASIAATLGVKESGSAPLSASLKEYTTDKQMLLTLDNFEQVMVAAPFIGELLAAAPQLRVLVTSREALHLAYEQEYAVAGLPTPAARSYMAVAELATYPAVALFASRAQAVKLDFTLDEQNIQAVADICARLDGLPLAIELAAARVRAFSLTEMLAQLGNRLVLLTGGPRNLPARQQTLRGAIDWSYSLLTTPEQQLFSNLAVFVGGSDPEAIAAICNPTLDLPHTLIQLIYKNLVRTDTPPVVPPPQPGEGWGEGDSRPAQGEGAVPPLPAGGEGWGEGASRYTMLETIREYALYKLVERDEHEAAAARHARYYLALAETAEPELRGADQAEWLARLEQERANLRVALNWGLAHDPDLALRLAGALWRFWEIHGHLSEGRGFLTAALKASTEMNTARAKALNGAGNLAFGQGDYPTARQFHEQALVLRRQLGDKRGIAASLNNLGNLAAEQGNYQAARILYEQSLAVKRELGDKVDIASALYNLGNVVRSQGDYQMARELLEESLSVQQLMGDKGGIADATFSLADITLYQGNYKQAHRLYEESLISYQQMVNKPGIARALEGLGLVAYSQGNFTEAQQLYGKALALSLEVGSQIEEAYLLACRGRLARAQGDYRTAQSLLRDSLALFWKLEHRSGVVDALLGLGILAAGGGSKQAARLAVRLLGSAAQILEIINWLPIERTQYDQALNNCRTVLGAAEFNLAWRKGEATSIEGAVAYALANQFGNQAV